MGLREGTSIRPKMFAIIDRTNMLAARNITGSPPVQSFLPNVLAGVDVDLESGGPGTFQLYDIRNPSLPLALQDGTSLTFEPSTPNEETVVIRRFNGVAGDPRNGHFVSNFRVAHTYPYNVVIRGNTGPWPNFSIGDCSSRSPGLIQGAEVYTRR